MNCVVLSVIWGVGSYSFYFTEFYMKYVPFDNIYMMSLIIGVTDVGGCYLFEVLVNWLKPKRLIKYSYLSLAIISFIFATLI